MTSLANNDTKLPKQPRSAGNKELKTKINALHDHSRSTVVNNRPGQIPDSRGRNQADSAQFPIQTETDSKYDDIAVIKHRLTKNAAGGMGPLGQVVATDKDIRWLHDKQKNWEFSKFNEWITRQYNLADPGTAAFVAKVYPDYFKLREEMIHQEAEQQLKLALLVERGPRDGDDLKLLYLIQAGKYKPKKGALWDPRDKSEKYSEMIGRGFFNPYRFSAPKAATQDASNPFAVLGDLRDVYPPGEGETAMGATLAALT